MDYLEHLKSKIVDIDFIKKNRGSFDEKRIVFTNGCFDILHVGHVEYLSQARSKGDVLVVGLNSDQSVKRLKGEMRPINPENARAIVLAALECVDFVIFFEEDTPYHLIKEVQPNILIKGGDYSIDTIVGADIVLQNGGVVETIPIVEGFSTTGILTQVNNHTNK